MLNKIFIEEKINLIQRDLSRMKIFSEFTISEMAEDFVKYSALKNILMEIIGRAIDINEHIITELADPKIDVPKTYKETFLLLKNLKVLPKSFAEQISKSAGFRNAIVHEYNNLDKGIVYQTVGDAIKQYSKYCQFISNFLNKKK